jgi:hypothetical protein
MRLARATDRFAATCRATAIALGQTFVAMHRARVIDRDRMCGAMAMHLCGAMRHARATSRRKAIEIGKARLGTQAEQPD